MLSIITPTHNTTYLKELEKSILDQSFQDWEWVVLLNNWAKVELSDDPRIKVYTMPFESTIIWQIKKYAFWLAKGEILCEIDHDDLITPDCLQEVYNAFQDKEVWFVSSDNAKLGEFVPYNPIYWWTYEMFEWQGQQLYKMNSQPQTAHHLSYIRHMPDHIRCWRKSVYDDVWGHDTTLDICDDHDIIARTYHITKFHHIPRCLYIYRITWDNISINHKNAEIQVKTVQLYDKYIYKTAERRADNKWLVKLDLCWWIDKPLWYTSIDKYNGDIIADLDQWRPLEDNSIWLIRAHDALEHLVDKAHTMKEIYRVLAPWGMLLSSTPSTDWRWAWQDPTHCAFRNENSFWYWVYWRMQPKYIYNTEHLFIESRLFTWFPSDWHKQNNINYVQANLLKPL